MAKKIKIELFSANACSRCFKAKMYIKAMVGEFDDKTILYRELDILEELDYAVALGVLATPAIVIDGELVFSGMPSINRLQDEINKRLAST
jgi:thioredoxin